MMRNGFYGLMCRKGYKVCMYETSDLATFIVWCVSVLRCLCHEAKKEPYFIAATNNFMLKVTAKIQGPYVFIYQK